MSLSVQQTTPKEGRIQIAPLGSVCEIISGQSPASEFYNKDGLGLPFYQGKADFGERHPTTRIWCTRPTKVAVAGDILFCVRAPVGPTNVATEECCIGRGLAAIRAGKAVDGTYLLHFLRSVESRFAQFSNGSTFKAITRSDLSTFEIPLPPLAAQQRIAAILDKADAIRRKRAQALELTDQFLQSVFLDMFGDPVTNPKGWDYAPLGDHLGFVTSGGRGWAKFYSETGSRFIRSLDVQMNYIGTDDVVFVKPPDNAEARRTRVERDDVLLTITGSRIGRVSVTPPELEGAYISQHVAILRITPGHLEPGFLSYFLSLGSGGQRQIEQKQNGQTKPGLNFDHIRSLSVPIPPIGLQHQFMRVAKALNKIQFRLHASLTGSEELFGSVVQRAFRGELQ